MVETLMMDGSIEKRMMRCNDEREMEILFEAAYHLNCKDCDGRYE